MSISTDDIIEIRKPAVRYPIHEVLKNRFSPRVFLTDPVPETDLMSMFEAARWSPSSNNRQPWFFFWTRNGSAKFKEILSCLNAGNYWAANAPVLVVACRMPYDRNGPNAYASYDLGQAVMSFVMQAHAMGYYVRQMGGFDKEKAKQVIPDDGAEPKSVIAVGKIGDYSDAPGELVAKDNGPRERKTDFVKEI